MVGDDKSPNTTYTEKAPDVSTTPSSDASTEISTKPSSDASTEISEISKKFICEECGKSFETKRN